MQLCACTARKTQTSTHTTTAVCTRRRAVTSSRHCSTRTTHQVFFLSMTLCGESYIDHRLFESCTQKIRGWLDSAQLNTSSLIINKNKNMNNKNRNINPNHKDQQQAAHPPPDPKWPNMKKKTFCVGRGCSCVFVVLSYTYARAPPYVTNTIIMCSGGGRSQPTTSIWSTG